jgi:cytochrome c-type biogenesis protein CcmE
MKPAHIIAIVVIITCMIVSLTQLSNAIAPHVGILDAIRRPGDTVQVPGKIDKATVRSTPNGLTFDILGIDRSGKLLVPEQRMTMVYDHPKPDSFDSAVSLEAVGTYRDGVFHASNLLVKCPSKYGDEKKPENKKQASLGPTEYIVGGGLFAAFAAAVIGFGRTKKSGAETDQEVETT